LHPLKLEQTSSSTRASANRNFTASIYQDLAIPEGATSLTLSFRYYLAASPPGHVDALSSKVYLLSGGSVVWESALIVWDRSNVPVWKQFAQELAVSATGPATLKITLFADVKEVGHSLFDRRWDRQRQLGR